MDLDKLQKQAKEIQNFLKIKTKIVGLKLLKPDEKIPHGAKQPTKDFGYHLDLCQAIGMSRTQNESIAMLKEDMWCFEPVVGLGMAEPPKEFLEGQNRYPWSVMDKADAALWAQNLPKFEVGTYKGVVTAPLESCNFEPDISLIFCDPEQLTHLLITKNCIDGEDLNCTMSGHAGCVYTMVPIIKENECKVVSPCRGFRSYAMTQRDELIFSCPADKIGDYLEGFKYLDKYDWKYPYTRHVKPERRLNDNYKKLGKKMGLDY